MMGVPGAGFTGHVSLQPPLGRASESRRLGEVDDSRTFSSVVWDDNGDCCLWRVVDWKMARAPQRATRDMATALRRDIDGDMVLVDEYLCCAKVELLKAALPVAFSFVFMVTMVVRSF